MKESSHIGYARYNMNYGIYAKIAIDNYTIAKELFTDLNKNQFIVMAADKDSTLEEKSIIAVVFSAMALESFFNDYAAWRLGDDLYYNTFDRLGVLEKFELIISVILKKDLDKSKSYYYRLKELIKHRNELVHNKSYSYNENVKIECIDKYIDDEYINVESTSKVLFNSAKNAVNAICEIASFFDEVDSDFKAKFRLLGLQTNYSPETIKKIL